MSTSASNAEQNRASQNPPTPPLAPSARVDVAALRSKLQGVRGQQYWQSLEELAETPEFREMVVREFPPGASEWWDGLNRRSFLKMAAATLALSGLTACTKQPTREIIPYVKQPAELVLGEPLYYATSMLLGGYATGVLAKSREGHPIKIDGNPQHPASLGGSNIWLQASILDLYDPDRSQTVNRNGEISTWGLFLADLNDLIQDENKRQGAGLRFLTETVTSPTLTAQLEDLLRKFPKAKWHQYDAISRDNVREGARQAFGQFVETQYDFEKAAVILSLDADFLYTNPQRLRYARQFTNARRVVAGKQEMNRLYHVESSPTVTGAMAEHRLPLTSAEIEDFAWQLVRELGGPDRANREQRESPRSSTVPAAWLAGLLNDLKEHRGASIIIPGESQPPIVHALAHWMNQSLGNVGSTIHYSKPAEAHPLNQLQSFRELLQEMKTGVVEALFILGGNPAYTAPVDLEFREALRHVKRSVHLGNELDETAALCTWHIPQTHYLESWSDARSYDGTVSFMQPLIAPLYGGRSPHELLGAFFQQQPVRSDYEIVRDFWRTQALWPDFEKGWRQALHDGLLFGTTAPNEPVQLNLRFLQTSSREKHRTGGNITVEPAANSRTPQNEEAFLGSPPRALKTLRGAIEVNFRPDPNLWDGRFANNGWLQECPRPVNKLTWDNAILISPAMAELGSLATGDVVDLNFGGGTIRGPVWIMPGQARNAVTLHLGYGRARAGRVGAGVGFDAYALRTSNALWSGQGASITATGRDHQFASTQTHHNLDSPDREVFRSGTLAEYLRKPGFVKQSLDEPKEDETLYYTDQYKYEGYKWGMSIDLTTCIGCNACLVACEVENNIPVVGKDQIHRNREMFWIRVDTYYKGSLENPSFNHMPVPCMHCEHAPCELVCPVMATVHDQEGLNLQVYNRCVGTRFCSNNCPYKVRRFNFYRYAPYDKPYREPMYNPEVTVRWRGVMEKCTYCIQRISAARISAEKENRRISEGEIRTACQQACPAEAIVFGDLNGPGSKVAKLKSHPLDYSMLGQLNTRPRTTYAAKLQNPNPQIKQEQLT